MNSTATKELERRVLEFKYHEGNRQGAPGVSGRGGLRSEGQEEIAAGEEEDEGCPPSQPQCISALARYCAPM